MKNEVVVGSRGSKLALIQAEAVASKIREVRPDAEVTIRTITTAGDRDTQTQLEYMGATGIFVKELEAALINGTIDLAVHSLKDVPTEIAPGLCLAATIERADPRDVLISRHGNLGRIPPKSKIGTGSLRRAVQVARIRPDLEAAGIRGNVDTRIRKAENGEFDGVVLAAAALHRLGREDEITEYLPLESFLPSAGQGALGIEIRRGEERCAEIATAINHLPTWQAVTAERAFLYALGGGCRAPIAALGTVDNGMITLKGMVASVRQNRTLSDSITGEAAKAAKIGEELAQKLLNGGASGFIAEVRDGQNG